MEHAPHSMSKAYELIFAAQACGMVALVRLPDQGGNECSACSMVAPMACWCAHRQHRDGEADHAADGLLATRRARSGRHLARRPLEPDADGRLCEARRRRMPAHDPARGLGQSPQAADYLALDDVGGVFVEAWRSLPVQRQAALGSGGAGAGEGRHRGGRQCRQALGHCRRRPEGSPHLSRPWLLACHGQQRSPLFGEAAQAAVAETLE